MSFSGGAVIFTSDPKFYGLVWLLLNYQIIKLSNYQIIELLNYQIIRLLNYKIIKL